MERLPNCRKSRGMTDADSKPRLLYFNGPWDHIGERMRVSFLEPFNRLLAQDFEVISVIGEADLASEVRRSRPDMILFHTGCECPQEPDVQLHNTEAFRDIPRMGFIWRDPWSPSRLVAMNRLLKWGVDQIVTQVRPTDCASDLFRDTFYLPFWVDDAVFRDYGETKVIPVMLAGEGWFQDYIYQWRSKVAAQLMGAFPVLHSRSGGNRQTSHSLCGERYARMLNRSCFSAGCGTIYHSVTLKLLEIPASRCCLITHETAALRHLGFRDGVNCVFADEEDVESKVGALLEDPERLSAITTAGFELVHANHTQRNRRLFREWFDLWTTKGPGQRVVQSDPFGPLQRVNVEDPVESTFPAECLGVEAIRDGYELVGRGEWRAARERFKWLTDKIVCASEAHLGIAICQMMLGLDNEAVKHVSHNIAMLQQHMGSPIPDPLDLAFLAVTLVRVGRMSEALKQLNACAELRHPSLNAVRWLLCRRFPDLEREFSCLPQAGDLSRTSESIHLIDQETFEEWVNLFESFLP